MIPGVIPRIVSGPTYRIHKTVETGRDPGDDVVPGVWERNVLARVVEKTDDCGTDIVRNVFASPVPQIEVQRWELRNLVCWHECWNGHRRDGPPSPDILGEKPTRDQCRV